MKFEKYQHIERLGTVAVDGILDGICYIFPKLDGTNTSVYLNDAGEVEVASRNRVLNIHDDNRGVCNYVLSQPKFKAYLERHPNHRLFGEWLVPHTVRGYRDDAWRKLYIFDVMDGDTYLPPARYFLELRFYDIDYVPVIDIVESSKPEDFNKYLEENTYLMQDGQLGEGIVIKRYDFVNRFGRTVWAKLVRPVVKVASRIQRPLSSDAVEPQIIEKFLTPELVEKEFSKLATDGWNSKLIPELFGVVWHAFITEGTFNFLRKFHNPKVDFGLLNRLAVEKIKAIKPELFYAWAFTTIP